MLIVDIEFSHRSGSCIGSLPLRRKHAMQLGVHKQAHVVHELVQQQSQFEGLPISVRRGVSHVHWLAIAVLISAGFCLVFFKKCHICSAYWVSTSFSEQLK
jgi:hypothetical protein